MARKAKVREVYAQIARPHAADLKIKVGVATVNADGTLSVQLDALPANGVFTVAK